MNPCLGLVIVLAFMYGESVYADGLTGNAEMGADVYRTHCVNCHGTRGWGDGPVAEFLTPRPADLTTGMVQRKSEKELLEIIREGKPGTSMPSWKKDISDQHIHDVLAFLRELGRKFPSP